MFTGLIAEKGKILSAKMSEIGKHLTISATEQFVNKIQVGDSVSINGVCQTAVKMQGATFQTEVMPETLKKTTLNSLQASKNVNLELAMTLNMRLGGHLVQGHIDAIGHIIQIVNIGSYKEFYISYPIEQKKYLVLKGAVAIDGASLTVADIYDKSFKVALISHTLRNTLFCEYKVGDRVNIEYDLIGKYVEQMMK